jgi:hypothetical protein
MLWLEVKNLHAEIDGAAARALWCHGYLPRVAVYNTKDEVDTRAQSMSRHGSFSDE